MSSLWLPSHDVVDAFGDAAPSFETILDMASDRGARSRNPRAWKLLEACYPMQEGGGLVAHDVAGGHQGTLTNGPTWGVGSMGRVVDVSGSAVQYVLCADVGLTSFSQVSWGCWFCLNAYPASYAGVFSVTNVGYGYIWWYQSKMQVRIAKVGGSYIQINNGPNVSLNEWHYANATYDGVAIRLYVDGKPVGLNGAADFAAMSGVPAIGVRGTGNGIDGLVGPAIIHSRALAASEIQQLYADPWGHLTPRLMFYPVASVSSTTINIAALLRRRRKSIYRR